VHAQALLPSFSPLSYSASSRPSRRGRFEYKRSAYAGSIAPGRAPYADSLFASRMMAFAELLGICHEKQTGTPQLLQARRERPSW